MPAGDRDLASRMVWAEVEERQQRAEARQRKRRTGAAVVLKLHVRRRLEIARFVLGKKAASRLQPVVRRALAQGAFHRFVIQRQENAAAVLQPRARRRLERERFFLGKHAATRLQLAVRRALAQGAFKQILIQRKLHFRAVNTLQSRVLQVLARVQFIHAVQARVLQAKNLQRRMMQAVVRARFVSSSVASVVLQSVVRRIMPVTGGEPSVLAESRSSVQAVSKEVFQTHLRMMGRGHKPAQDGEDTCENARFLNPALNSSSFLGVRRSQPREVLFWLREIAEEKSLQKAVDLEVITVKAASNILFRNYVRRKRTEVRQRIQERKARELLEWQERQHRGDGKRIFEERRMQTWLTEERQLVKQKLELDGKTKGHQAGVRRFVTAKFVAMQQRARDRAKLHELQENEAQELQALAAEVKKHHQERRKENDSRVSHLKQLKDRIKLTPLRSSMTHTLTKPWGKGVNDVLRSQVPLRAGVAVLPWDHNVLIEKTSCPEPNAIRSPLRLEPLRQIRVKKQDRPSPHQGHREQQEQVQSQMKQRRALTSQGLLHEEESLNSRTALLSVRKRHPEKNNVRNQGDERGPAFFQKEPSHRNGRG